MAFSKGIFNSMHQLLDIINKAMVAEHWKDLRHDDDKNYYMWEGTGDGNDKIYLQMYVEPSKPHVLCLDSAAGFDEHLEKYEQPGSLQQLYKATRHTIDLCDVPCISISDKEQATYFLFVNTYRVVCVIRLSTQYLSFYAGFINPIASERQYPYPMYIAGSSSFLDLQWPNEPSSSFVFPIKNAGKIRRVDGTWRGFNSKHDMPTPNQIGSVFPYTAHNRKLIPNYMGHKTDSSVDQRDFLLLPVTLRTEDPIDMTGILRDVYWISGTRDLAAEQTFVCDGVTYIAFDTKDLRSSNSYFAIAMR